MRASFAALILALASCTPPPPPAAPERPPAPVLVATAVAADAAISVDEIGRCVSLERVTLRPQVSTRLDLAHVADGADVKAGQKLFTLDARPFQAELAAAVARASQDQAVLDLAKAELKRAETLLEKKALSRQEFDAAKSAVDVSSARLAADAAAEAAAKLRVEWCELRAPIAGRAGRRLVDPGNLVKENETELLVIQGLDPLNVEFSLSELRLAELQKALAAGPVKAEVRLPDDPGPPLAGEVTFVDNAVQAGTGTVLLRVTLPNPERRLWPGRFVRVRLPLASLPGALQVPALAPQTSATGPFVYVVKDDGTAELRPVRLGPRVGDAVVVESGLKAGEKVVVQGHLGVMPGGKVRAEAPKP